MVFHLLEHPLPASPGSPLPSPHDGVEEAEEAVTVKEAGLRAWQGCPLGRLPCLGVLHSLCCLHTRQHGVGPSCPSAGDLPQKAPLELRDQLTTQEASLG